MGIMNKKLYSLLVISTFMSGISYSCYAVSESEKPAIGAIETRKKLSSGDVVYRVNLGRADDVAILLKQGASANGVNESGVPLISLASSRSDSESLAIVKLLVEAGADVNKTDRRGQNALFHAAKTGNKEVVEYLLAQKIRYTATDSAGNNARVIAYQTGHNDIVEILDNFIREQNNLARQKYEEINKQLEEYYKTYNESIQGQNKQITSEKSIASEKSTSSEKSTNIFGDPISESFYIKELIYKASFASCSSSYWQFCHVAGQPTEFSTHDLISVSTTQSEHAKEIARELTSNYNINADVIQNIMTVSGEKIRNQLAAFGFNDARKDAGVGALEDMNKRCGLIATAWKVNETTPNQQQKSTYPQPFSNQPQSPQPPAVGKPATPSWWR